MNAASQITWKYFIDQTTKALKRDPKNAVKIYGEFIKKRGWTKAWEKYVKKMALLKSTNLPEQKARVSKSGKGKRHSTALRVSGDDTNALKSASTVKIAGDEVGVWDHEAYIANIATLQNAQAEALAKVKQLVPRSEWPTLEKFKEKNKIDAHLNLNNCVSFIDEKHCTANDGKPGHGFGGTRRTGASNKPNSAICLICSNRIEQLSQEVKQAPVGGFKGQTHTCCQAERGPSGAEEHWMHHHKPLGQAYVPEYVHPTDKQKKDKVAKRKLKAAAAKLANKDATSAEGGRAKGGAKGKGAKVA